MGENYRIIRVKSPLFLDANGSPVIIGQFRALVDHGEEHKMGKKVSEILRKECPLGAYHYEHIPENITPLERWEGNGILYVCWFRVAPIKLIAI